MAKIWKKLFILKMLKLLVLHNDNAEKLFLNWWKKDCRINKQVQFLFFRLNEFIDFPEYLSIVSEFSYNLENSSFEKNSRL